MSSPLSPERVSVQLLTDPQKDGYLTKLGGKGITSCAVCSVRAAVIGIRLFVCESECSIIVVIA